MFHPDEGLRIIHKQVVGESVCSTTYLIKVLEPNAQNLDYGVVYSNDIATLTTGEQRAAIVFAGKGADQSIVLEPEEALALANSLRAWAEYALNGIAADKLLEQAS